MFNTSTSNRVRVMIPNYRNMMERDKNYTVYCIEVIFNGNVKLLQKRYSEFYDMYKKLQKVIFVKMSFPPKRVLNKDHKVLESRRKGLESYLQALLQEVQENIPERLQKFLEIEDIDFSDDELVAEHSDGDEDNTKVHNSQHHQSMVCFDKNVFLHATVEEMDAEKHLPDIVMKGCLDCIYQT